MKSINKMKCFILVSVLSSCQYAPKSTKLNCGIGVLNKGSIDVKGVKLVIKQEIFDFGSSSVGSINHKVDGFVVDSNYDYSAMVITYELIDGNHQEASYSLRWVRPPQSKYENKIATMIIYIYPGRNQDPRIVWEAW